MVLELKDISYHRGEDGKLISQEVVLETLPNKPTVRIVPLTRGKLQEIYSKATSDNAEDKIKADTDIILNGLVEPVVNEENVKDLKPQFATAISIAILSASLGISQEEVGKKTQELINEQELELKKK